MERLQQLLEHSYPMTVRSLALGPRQFVAETFVVRAAQDERYFVKRFPADRLPRHALASLPVLRALYGAGFRQINVPLPTRTGDLFAHGDDGVVVVFNYIDAPQTFEYDMRALGSLIAGLHQQTGQIGMPMSREPFAPPYAAEWYESVRRATRLLAPEPVLAGLQQILETYGAELERDWDAFERVAAMCRAAGMRYVITHGDAPGNVLQDRAGTIYLVDWDEILLAPAERDTWFLLDNPDFMAGYRSIFAGYVPNDLAYRFYLLNRYFEDWLGFVKEILGHGSDEHRAWNLRQLQKDCLGWLRPAVRAST